MIEELRLWSLKVSLNKKGLDKEMFDELIKLTLSKLEKVGYDKTFNYLEKNYSDGLNNNMRGVVLLRNNSKQIRDKLWSINRRLNKGAKS